MLIIDIFIEIITIATISYPIFKLLFQDLGKTVDFARQKVYLVAYVVRVGAMEYKEKENETKKESGGASPFISKTGVQIRRPYGVAAKDVTSLFRENISKPTDNELQTVFYLP